MNTKDQERKLWKQVVLILWKKDNCYEITVVLILAATAVMLNSLQIIFILKRQRSRKWHSSSIFALNVAIADILVPISNVMYKTFPNRASYFVLTTGMQASIFLLLGLAFDRLYAVKKPMKYRMIKVRTVLGFCIFFWAISMSIATVACLIYVYANGIYLDFNETFLPSIIYLGLVTIAVTYVYIYLKVSTHMGKMNNRNKIDKASITEVFKKREKKLVVYSINGVIDPFLLKIYVHKKPVNDVSAQRDRAATQITVTSI